MLRRASLASTLLLIGVSGTASAQFNDNWLSFTKDPTAISSPAAISDADHETDMAWGDLDQDGDIDLVVVRKQPFMTTGRRRNVLLMNVNGVLTDQTTLYAAASDVGGDNGFSTLTNDRDVVIVDVDNDGWLDVVTAATLSDGLPKHISHPRVYLNLKNDALGAWQGLRHEDARVPQLLHHTSGIAVSPRFNSVAAGDINNDGSADLYFGDSDTGPPGSQTAATDPNDRLLLNDGFGFFTDASTTSMTTAMLKSNFTSSTTIADLNGDGALDVLKQSSHGTPTSVYVAYNNPASQGNFLSYQQFYGNSPYYVSAGDLNNDGRLDLVAADNGTDKYLYNTGNNGSGEVIWSAKNTFNFLSGGDDSFGSNILIDDLDGDGWNDVIICDVDIELPGYNRRVHIYHNRGGTVGGQDIVLREERENTTTAGWIGVEGMFDPDMKGTHDVAVFDLDNDGDKDMVLSRLAATEVWINNASTCQPDLGFGNGSSSLSVCGGDLAVGNDATMLLEGGPAGAPCFMFIGVVSAPSIVPELAGATLVPVPPALIVNFPLSPAGGFSLPVAGGQGAFTAYVQCVIQLAASTYEVSNAVQVNMQ